jgi:putative sterol carrier protein
MSAFKIGQIWMETVTQEKESIMTYQEIVAKAKEMYEGVDAGNITEHIAYQFNVTGEGEGAFYMEITEGKIKVEPYDYVDRDALITTSAENLLAIATAKLDPVQAYLTGKIKVEGNLGKAAMLKELSAKAAAAVKVTEEPAKIAEPVQKEVAGEPAKAAEPVQKEVAAEPDKTESPTAPAPKKPVSKKKVRGNRNKKK